MTPHSPKMAHKNTVDGIACPRNCPYDGPDRREAYDYAPQLGKQPARPIKDSQSPVETKEGDSAGHIGNKEHDPFGGGGESDEVPVRETKSLEDDHDSTGHYPAAPNCIFASAVNDLDGKCEKCPEERKVIDAPFDTGLVEYAMKSAIDVGETGGSFQISAGLKEREGDQHLPVVNDEEDCQTTFLYRVSKDMPVRRAIGIARYGTALQPFNGRDFARDAWEEYLDLGQYIEGLRRERDRMILVLKAVVASDYAEAGGGREVAVKEAESLLRAIGELGLSDAQNNKEERVGEG